MVHHTIWIIYRRRIRNIRISKALFQSQVQFTRFYMSGDMDNIENAEMEKLEAFEMWLWRNYIIQD